MDRVDERIGRRGPAFYRISHVDSAGEMAWRMALARNVGQTLGVILRRLGSSVKTREVMTIETGETKETGWPRVSYAWRTSVILPIANSAFTLIFSTTLSCSLTARALRFQGFGLRFLITLRILIRHHLPLDRVVTKQSQRISVSGN
jgi:hypothetical protein